MKSLRKFYLILWTFIFLCNVIPAGLPLVRVLSIYNRKNPSERYYIEATEIDGFEISYTHSVNKGRVHDFYKIWQDKGLVLTSTRFVSYGAGIPEPEETEGAVFTVTDYGYEISNLQRKVPKLTMAVGIIANHELTIGGNTYAMTDLFEPQTSIIFEKKRVSLINYKLHKLNKKRRS